MPLGEFAADGRMLLLGEIAELGWGLLLGRLLVVNFTTLLQVSPPARHRAPGLLQCRDPSSSASAVGVKLCGMRGGCSASLGLQISHGAPAPQSHASARLLNILNGRSGWFSHTQPVSSQLAQGMALDIVYCHDGWESG
jgi:hypothetical protein